VSANLLAGISEQEAERSGRPFLLLRDGTDTQQFFFFAPDALAALVGRRPNCDLKLEWDDQVSRTHARFERDGDAWTVVDEGMSSNGTFVNGERIAGKRRLGDGDTLQFGKTVVKFRAPPPEPAPTNIPAVPAAPSAAAAPAAPVPAPAAPARAAAGLSTTQRRVLVALCRPYKERSYASPATDDQIAEELFLSPGEVKAHLRVLRAKLGVAEQPEAETRVRLVDLAFSAGLVSERDL
jgi:hypothetical protein